LEQFKLDVPGHQGIKFKLSYVERSTFNTTLWLMRKPTNKLKWNDKMRRMMRSVQFSHIFVKVKATPYTLTEGVHLGGEVIKDTSGDPDYLLIPTPSRGIRERSALVDLVRKALSRGDLASADFVCSTDKAKPREITRLGTMTLGVKNSKSCDFVIKTYVGLNPTYDLVYRAANLADSHK